jgi:hypothetical protein
MTGPESTFPVVRVTVMLSLSYAVLAMAYGPIVTSDAVEYSDMARALAALDYNPVAYLRHGEEVAELNHPVAAPFYLAFVFVIGLAQELFVTNWPYAVVAFNVVMQTIAAFVILLTVVAVSGPAAAWIAAALLAVLFDFNQWVAMTQSDPMFVAISAVAVSAGLRAADSERPDRIWPVVTAVGACLLIVFVRPAWPPVIATMLVVALLAVVGRREPFSRAAVLLGFGIAGLAAVLGLWAAAQLYFDPTALPGGIGARFVAMFRPDLVGGVVVIARPETYIAPVETAAGFLNVMGHRLVYFFWFEADGFSTQHRLLNILGHVPLYAFAVIGIVVTLLRIPNRRMQHAGIVAIVWIATTDLYHAVTVLDFDWRYRAPTYFPLVLLASAGAAAVLTGLGSRWSGHLWRGTRDIR